MSTTPTTYSSIVQLWPRFSKTWINFEDQIEDFVGDPLQFKGPIGALLFFMFYGHIIISIDVLIHFLHSIDALEEHRYHIWFLLTSDSTSYEIWYIDDREGQSIIQRLYNSCNTWMSAIEVAHGKTDHVCLFTKKCIGG